MPEHYKVTGIPKFEPEGKRRELTAEEVRELIDEPNGRAFAEVRVEDRCRWRWTPGLIVPPGEAPAKPGRCILEAGHQGDHEFATGPMPKPCTEDP